MPSFHVLCFDCAGAPGVVCLSRVLLTKIESPRFHFIRFRCCFSLHYIRSASFVYRLAFSFFFFRVVLVVSVSVRV